MLVLVISCIVLLLVIIGGWERMYHQRKIDQIPLRLNINGSRGKSTVTRLVTSILVEAGWRTIGKTTGSAARMLYWFSEQERPIQRGPLGPNISEQKQIVNEAANWQTEALVSECMALKPSYQIVFQHKLVQAQLVVITNVLEDHLDVMGPTLDDVAHAFAATIPYDGILVIAPGPYANYFCEVAEDRRTRVFIARPQSVDERRLQNFTYLLFEENVALALAVAEALQIDEAIAWHGMMNAKPDPGALTFDRISGEGWQNDVWFFNGFAANDPQSAIAVWEKIVANGFPAQEPIIVFNCRADRVERTRQFVRDVLPQLPPHRLLAIGSRTELIAEAIAEGELEVIDYIDLENADAINITKALMNFSSERQRTLGYNAACSVVGLGNIHGAGMELLRYLRPEDDQAERGCCK
jgi:poly-gamma-glutamate synthase PgsB/CapB